MRSASNIKVSTICLLISIATALLSYSGFIINDVRGMQQGLAIILLVICLIPAKKFIYGNYGNIAFLPTICVFYACFYSLPVLFGSHIYSVFRYGGLYRFDYEEMNLTYALLLTIYSMILLIVAYEKSPWKNTLSKPKFFQHLRYIYNQKSFLIPVAIVSTFGMIGMLVMDRSGAILVGSGLRQLFVMFTNEVFILGMIIFFTLEIQKKIPIPYRLLFRYLYIPTVIYLTLSSLFLGYFLRISATFIMIFISYKRKIPIKTLVAAFTIVLALMIMKADLRDHVETEAGDTKAFVSSISFICQEVSNLNHNSSRMIGNFQEMFSTRYTHINILSYILSEVPKNIDYLYGKSYSQIPWKFIPRILFPDKPIDNYIVKGWAIDYEIADEDTFSAVRLPQMIELYLNFGIFGVSIGMCLLGFMYRAFAGFPGSDSFDRLGFIYTAYLFSIVCDIEGAMSMVLGKVLYYGSFILVLVHLNIIIGRKLSKKVR